MSFIAGVASLALMAAILLDAFDAQAVNGRRALAG
jgi:hypothetical protein